MKRVKFSLNIFVIAACTLLITTCDLFRKKESDELSVANTSLDFLADDDQEIYVDVKTNVKSWDAIPSTNWIKLDKDAKGFYVTVDKHTATDRDRTGRITVEAGNADRVTVNLKQAAARINSLSVSPPSISFAANETGAKTATVSTDAATWDATMDPSEWLTLEKTGNSLKVTVNSMNTVQSQRSAPIIVTAGNAAPVTVVVTQAGTTANTLSVEPTSIQYATNETGTKSAVITTSAASWDAASSADWLSFSKDGNTLKVTVHTLSTSQRNAVITVTAVNAPPVSIDVTQAATVSNTLSVNPATIDFAAGETGVKTATIVTDAASWDATVSEGWVTLDKQTNTLRVTVNTLNTGSALRSATINVTAGNANPVAVTVRQEPTESNTLSVHPTSIHFLSGETDAKTVTITTNAASWDAKTSYNWINIEKDGVTLKVTPNSLNRDVSQRSASINVTAGDADPVTIQVTQEPTASSIITYTKSEGEYWGNYYNSGTGNFELWLYTDATEQIGIRIEGFCALATNSANFRLDAGTYTLASSGAVRTFFPGSVKDDKVSPTYLFDRNSSKFTLITGGTITVALSGSTYTISGNLTGQDANNGTAVNDINISYLGSISFTDKTGGGGPSFNDIANSAYAATGTPMPTTGTPAPNSWTGQITPNSGNQNYRISNWARISNYYVYVKYNNGNLILDTTTKLGELSGSGVSYDIYCRPVYQSGTSVYILTEYSVTYDKASRTLDFSGTYNGNAVSVGFVGQNKNTGAWSYFGDTQVRNAKLVLTSTSSASPQSAGNNHLENRKRILPNNMSSSSNRMVIDESKLEKIPVTEMLLLNGQTITPSNVLLK